MDPNGYPDIYGDITARVVLGPPRRLNPGYYDQPPRSLEEMRAMIQGAAAPPISVEGMTLNAATDLLRQRQAAQQMPRSPDALPPAQL